MRHFVHLNSVSNKKLFIKNGKISRIVSIEDKDYDQDDLCLNLKNKVLLPGFVDVHVHLDKAFTWPNINNRSGTLREAIANYQANQHNMTVKDIEERMAKNVRYALRHGTTAMRTHLDYGSPTYLEKVVQAFQSVKANYADDIYLEAVLMCPHEIDAKAEQHIKWAIREGISLLGGAPHLSSSPRANINKIFDLAVSFDIDIDLHVDESDNPNVKTIKDVCHYTRQAQYEGRVIAGHCTSLAAMDQTEAEEVMAMIKEAHVGIVTLPATNLYLMGRNDVGFIRRGVTRVKELLERSIPVAVASDNVRDPFHPYGKADMLQMILLTSYATHMTSEQEMNKLFEMITYIPAGMMGLKNYGLSVGDSADFVIVPADDPKMVLAEMPTSREVWKNGRKICSVSESVIWHRQS